MQDRAAPPSIASGSQQPPLQTRLPWTSSGTHGQQPHGSTHPVEHMGGAAQPTAAQSVEPPAPAAPPVAGVAPPVPPPAPAAPEAPPPPSGLAGEGSLVAPPQAASRSSQPTIPDASR